VKHIVFDSGGIGSYSTLKRVIAKVGKENVIRLFTDTLIEDKDLYRFQKDVTRVTGLP
jgi:ferritin-like metal-binding protein YciE